MGGPFGGKLSQCYVQIQSKEKCPVSSNQEEMNLIRELPICL